MKIVCPTIQGLADGLRAYRGEEPFNKKRLFKIDISHLL
jgi:hypothetical protein